MVVIHKYRARFDYSVGHISHYGHFLVDAVLPFASLYESWSNELSLSHEYELWLTDTMNQHMGDRFHHIFTLLFPKVSFMYCPIETWNQLSSFGEVVIRGCQFGPYEKTTLVALHRVCDHFMMKLPRDISPSFPQVILIERGFQPIDLPPQFSIHRHHTGSRRRSLTNHREVERAVTAWSRKNHLTFENIILENMPWERQIYYFQHAQIIIGQHGAGLCNVMFCQPSSRTHIFEISYWGLNTIRHLCHANNLSWYKVESNARMCNISHLLTCLSTTVEHHTFD